MTTFQDYNIIDYDHKFTITDNKWYNKNLAIPLESWQSTNDTTYIDVFDVERTVPQGTWWLKSMVTDPDAIKELDNMTLNSYSLSTANKEFADKLMKKYALSTKSIPVDDMLSLKKEYNISFKHRTLIKDIHNPVAFTVSLTGFPCVGGAVFAKKCLEDSKHNSQSNKNKGDTMTEGINLSFDNLKELLSMKSKKDVYVTEEKLQETFEEHDKKLVESFTAIIDDKLGKKDDDKDDDSSSKKDDKKDDDKLGKKDDDKDKKMSNKSQSKQIDHKDDGDDTISHKSGTPEHKLLQQLGRDANGNSLLKL